MAYNQILQESNRIKQMFCQQQTLTEIGRRNVEDLL